MGLFDGIGLDHIGDSIGQQFREPLDKIVAIMERVLEEITATRQAMEDYVAWRDSGLDNE